MEFFNNSEINEMVENSIEEMNNDFNILPENLEHKHNISYRKEMIQHLKYLIKTHLSHNESKYEIFYTAARYIDIILSQNKFSLRVDNNHYLLCISCLIITLKFMGNFDISDRVMKSLIKSKFHSYPNYEMSCMYSLDYNLIYTTAYNFISLISGKYNEKVYDRCKSILFQFIENEKFLNYSPFLTAVAIFKLSKQICNIRKYNYYDKFFKNKRVIEIENILKANYSDNNRYINSGFEENYSPIKVKLSNYHINIRNNNNNNNINNKINNNKNNNINNNINNDNNNITTTAPNNLKKILYRKIPYSYQKKYPLNSNHSNPSPTFCSSNNNRLNYSSSKKIFYRYNINKNYTNLNNSGSNNSSFGSGNTNNNIGSNDNSIGREGNYRTIRDNSYGYENSYRDNSSSSNNVNQINNSSDFVYNKNLNNNNNLYLKKENFIKESSINRRELLNNSSNSSRISNNIPLIKRKKNIINSNIIRKNESSKVNNRIAKRINYNEINNRINIDLGQVSKLSFERLAKLSIRYLKNEKSY